ncbi:hypothetical protein C8R44DRAFT_896375 [Mycena epipterygia]|nr:hypothetical protein C8R44DRAFT_896375 [Mycena epipterygia]
MIAFSKEHFSEADCRVRALGSGAIVSSTKAAGKTTTAPSAPAPTPTPPPASSAPVVAPVGEQVILGFNDILGDDGGLGDDMGLGNIDLNRVGNGPNANSASQDKGNKEGEGLDVEAQKMSDALWHHDDRAEWTVELAKAHAAFKRGQGWGMKWAGCVSNFFDFEAAHGYSEGKKINVKECLQVVQHWLSRGWKWERGVDLPILGSQQKGGTYIGSWWQWWAWVQPEEHELVDGDLTKPGEVDWGYMSTLHGKNRMLQVMATLLWWGDHTCEDEATCVEWERAVDDVAWVLQELQQPDILKEHSSEGQKKRKRVEANEMVEPPRTRKKAKPTEGGADDSVWQTWATKKSGSRKT